jgi:BlaI family transcriptional regulator, penicillinase repressor
MPKAATPHLTLREREIMDILFSLGEASSEDVRTRLSNPPSNSAVRAMLVRLENKGQIRHREAGLRYLYTPTRSPVTARRLALKQYLGTYFGGSLRRMVTSLLQQESWTEEELATLRREIDHARKERKRS